MTRILSEAAKLYQLTKGHRLTATLYTHGKEVPFKYGLENAYNFKATYVHGIEGGQNVIQIETVEPLTFTVGEKVKLVDGKCGKVTDVTVSVLDQVQLRFVSYERADKLQKLTIRFI